MGSKVKKYSKVKIVCPIFLFLVAIVCASMPTASKTQNPMKASWNGRYQHVSRAFELLLKKFDVDSVAVDIIRTDPAEKSETVASFFAVLKDDVVVFQDRHEPACRMELKKVNDGIVVSDFCGGTGEDVGLYRPIPKSESKK